jgi:hypothetical protein
MALKIFISMGSTATKEQRAFVDAILSSLKTVELSPRIMNENEWSYEQPLRAIRKIMKECCGAVIIAFTRTTFPSGVEIRKDKDKVLTNVSLPTPWNHIEASMAYAYKLPLLVIAENGLKSEGLIEQGYDWRVYWTDLDPSIVKTEKYRGFLNSWKKAVEVFTQQESETISKQLSPDKISVGILLKSMSIPQLWKLFAAVIAALSAIAAAAFKLGGGKWPWQ